MATSDNLEYVEPWLLRPAFPELCFSDAFDSLFTNSDDAVLSHILSPQTNTTDGDGSGTNTTPTLSTESNPTPPAGAQSITLSGFNSEPETLSKSEIRTSRCTAPPPPPPRGRIGKRKSRPSNKSPTTFITADAANFRQMVQQVTGVTLPSSMAPPLLKPEPHRSFRVADACLPTLDSSAFLLDHHHHHHQQAAGRAGAVPVKSGKGTVLAPPPPLADIGGRRGMDFDSFACFPTLESGKVM